MAKDSTPAGLPGEADPSMDDILASIRRILSDEEKAAKNAAPSDDVLKLEPSMMVDEATPAETHPMPATTPSDAAHEAPMPDHMPDHMTHHVPERAAETFSPVRAEPLAGAEPARPPSAAASVVDHLDAGSGGRIAPQTGDPNEALIAPEAAAQAATSVGTLMRTLMSERHAVVHRGGPTIEDLVREEIRPLLKGWLDRHLPDMVERLVRAEIERVVGRITG